NQRRRDSKKLKFLKRTGEFPENATIADLQHWRNARLGMHRQEPGTGSSRSSGDRNPDAAALLEAEREKLLAAIESGQVEVREPPSRSAEAASQEQDKAADLKPSSAATAKGRQETAEDASLSRPRAKLDITSSRRMLFT